MPAPATGRCGVHRDERGRRRTHPRLSDSFPHVLGHYCRDRGLFALETAVHKMARLTAARSALADCGFAAPGRAADMTVFDAASVIDRATFDEPEQDRVGIEWVLVNGQVAWVQGQAGSWPDAWCRRGADGQAEPRLQRTA